jgi:DNA-directed RNA polymerase subunit M/transcription elongation factor TFIIS
MGLDPTLKAFVNAKPHELCPDKWEKAFEDAARKALRFTDASAMDPEQMPDGILVCRCGSKKTSYYEMQTKSADEPMTVFARCHTCSAKWKQ